MADFIARLAERALDEPPAVQPLVPSVFAPEPTSHAPDREWEVEEITSSDDPDRAQLFSDRGQYPFQAASKENPEDAATRSKEHPISARATSPPSVTPEAQPETRRPTGRDPSTQEAVPAREDRGSPAPAAPKPAQRMPEPADPESTDGRADAGGEERGIPSPATAKGSQKTPVPRPGTSLTGSPDPPEQSRMLEHGQRNSAR